jgi:nucleoside-diphosphate-sugar epimerase
MAAISDSIIIDMIKPALQGTINLLNSVKKHNSNIKRVVATSSIASVGYDEGGEPTYFDEVRINLSGHMIRLRLTDYL